MAALYHKHRPRQIMLAVCLLIVGLGFTACGKKPGQLDPPDGVTDDKFPLTYPDLATDPKPVPPDNQQ